MTELKTLTELNPKVGDVVFYKEGNGSSLYRISKIVGNQYYSNCARLGERLPYWQFAVKTVAPSSELTKTETPTTKTGGPAKYYDYPFKNWVTVNDMIDYLSQKQWGWRSYIFKDILKACFRWGQKEGTTEIYDAEKIVYYGVRLLLSVSDIKSVREYLQTILDDEQFKDN